MMTGGLKPGAQISPSLRLRELRAAGGMGTIWLADHLGLRTTVMVKFLLPWLADRDDMVSRFSREAEAASRVRSPHVVQMLDHGVTSEGLPYIAMELLDGCSLADFLELRGRLPPRQAAFVVSQAAKALSAAHAKGVVHRDIKPDNIFLCRLADGDALVKVLDFGIAKFASHSAPQSTATGAVLGTPYYMSPEQVQASKEVDHRADLWALAAVAYEMLTGTRMIEGENVLAILASLYFGEKRLPSTIVPDLPQDFDGWFRTACAPTADARFQSARALSDSFVAVAGGVEVLDLSVIPRHSLLFAFDAGELNPSTGSGQALPDAESQLLQAHIPTGAGVSYAKRAAGRGHQRLGLALVATVLLAGGLGSGLAWYTAGPATRPVPTVRPSPESAKSMVAALTSMAGLEGAPGPVAPGSLSSTAPPPPPSASSAVERPVRAPPFPTIRGGVATAKPSHSRPVFEP